MREVVLWIVIGGFFATWAAFAVGATLRGCSKTIAWGGGFLTACIALGVLGMVVRQVFDVQPPKLEADASKVSAVVPLDNAPVSLKLLSAKAAASHAVQDLRLIEVAMNDLKSALETTDRAGFRKYVTVPLVESSKWWDDYEYPWEFNSCKAALGHAHSYAMTMWTEYFSDAPYDGVWNRKSRDMADRNLKDSRHQCREAIRTSGRA